MEDSLEKYEFKKLKDIIKNNEIELFENLYIRNFNNDCLRDEKINITAYDFYRKCDNIYNSLNNICYNNNSYYQENYNVLHINPIFRTKEFFKLFCFLGYSISIHIITECTVIYKNEYNQHIVLAGKFKKKEKCVNSRKLFLTRRNITHEYFTDFMNEFRLLDAENSYYQYINNFAKCKIQRVRYKKIFYSIFAIELSKKNIDCAKKYINNAVCKQRIVNFLFIITKKCFSRIFNYKSILLIKNKIYKFVYLNKKEYLNTTELMRGIKLKDIAFFDMYLCNERKTKLLEICCVMLLNLFENFYNFILNRFFYFTETTFSGNKYLYYLKPFWNNESTQFLKNHLSRYELIKSKVNNNPVINNLRDDKISREKHFYVPSLRLIPKHEKLRPITNSRRKNQLIDEKNTQKIFYNMLCSFGFYIPKHKMFKKIICFGLKNRNQNIYAIKIDLASCFDLIPQDILKKMIYAVDLKSQTYLRTYKTINLDSSPLHIKFHSRLDDHQMPFCNFLKFINMKELSIACDLHYCVKTKGEIKNTIIKVLEDSKIIYKGNIYKQSIGIPQGSILSCSLCNLFLGNATKEYFDLDSNVSSLLRYVDDYLFLTTSQNEIKNFLENLFRLREVDIKINLNKMQTNFNINEILDKNKSSENVLLVKDNCKNIKFPEKQSHINWCGLKIYPKEFSIKSIFDESTHYTFVYVCDKPGYNFKNKIFYTLKCRLSNVFTFKDNKKTFQNSFDYLNFFYKRIYKYIKLMPFINSKFFFSIIETGDQMLKQKYICNQKNLLRIYSVIHEKARLKNKKLFDFLTSK